MNRLMLATMTALLAWTVGATAHAGVNIAPKPLSMSTGEPPNILLILDNSNTMAENLDGTVAADCAPGPDADCVAGAASPLSKSEMIREVGRGLLTTYRDEINLGLMAYQQYPMGSEWADVFDNQIWVGRLGNRFYDVSYDPDSYDSGFSGTPWDSDTKAFRVPNPNSAGDYIHYNIGVPGYGPSDTSQYCFTRDPGGGYLEEGFRFRCFGSKTGTSDAVPPDQTNPGGGFTGHQGTTTGYLSDSARARGVTHWGEHMVFMQYNHPEWIGAGSPGKGFLHTPIRYLDENHAARLALKLAPQHHDTSNDDLLTDPDEPVIVAGLTPLQGTLLTARDYFLDQTQHFGADQGRGNADESLPESCDVNAAIWLTDGMPSVRVDGDPYQGDVDQALADAVDAAGSFHGDAGVDIYVVGFAMPPAVPDDALEQLADAGGTESPFLANDPDALFDAVNDIFQQIIADAQSEFGSIDSGAVLRSGNLGFRTMADPADWSGDVYGVRNPDGSEQVAWRASEQMPDWNQRNLITDGGDFDTGSSELIDALHDDEDTAAAIVSYIQGDPLLEQQNEGPFQNRSSLIGTVVGSQPALQRPVNHAWDRLPEGEPGAGTYNSHVESKFNRRDVVYVGSNAGVLHALDAETGEELFGYVPRGVWSRLADVANPVPDFVYTVDGSVVVTDAYLPGRGGWRTVLLGSLGAGGKSVFAIDVTNPASPSVLWEVTAEDLPDSGDLGHTFATPRVARLENGDFAAVVGNGYGSDNNDSRLLVFDLDNGDLIGNLLGATGSESEPNGLSTPRVARQRPHEYYDRWVYAGDLQGNLWRFDLNNLGGSGQLVFSGDRPITAPPQTSYPRGGEGFVVSFGTGQFFEVGDNASAGAPDEYFYLIHDLEPEDGALNLSRGNLVSRSFGGASTGEQDAIDPEDDNGWYVNLGSGARMLFQPRVVSGMVLFSSFRPSQEACSVGGENEAYLLEVTSGQGAFAPGGVGRQSGIEGAPSRPGFSVREREAVDEDGEVIEDPDTGEPVMVPEVVVRVGDEEIVVESDGMDDLAADLAGGRRSNWLQLR